jgi:hypothetical protein
MVTLRTVRATSVTGLALACGSGSPQAGGQLPTELAQADFVVVEGRVYPDSVPESERVLGPQCPIRLRDTRTGTEFLIASEEVMETDSLPRAEWRHEAEYMILVSDRAPGRASTLLRLDCRTLKPLRLITRGA